MAAITLRDYIREIEKQVDGNRNEEAIAHSRHVLESFPKHVDVYRLLGKAYLESQRYGDAGDIFQRVLSAVPEDFVSHVGMSIIREDEGNLDEAIWHMERAFDIQPSNSAIQEELRRLYGRRDNVEPPKIRLTRGALARMYYKGDLYPQAIAELRAALSENPDRLDLQALLAEVYARAGQRVEAVEMASQVLRKLPYCLAANRIMVEMLIGTDRESEIETYFQRLCQLDPYAAQVTSAAPRAENVPDQAIRLTKLDYKASPPGEGAPSQPVWAATLGIEVAEMATGAEEALPEWLAAGPSESSRESEPLEGGPVPAFTSEEALSIQEQAELPGAISEEEQIPDWMKDMGWGPASEEGKAAEAALQFEEAETPLEEGELAAAEIPDWLKAMAPSEAQEPAQEEDVSPWLEQLFSGETQAGVAQEQEITPFVESGEQALSGSLDWMEAGLAAGAVAAGAAALDQEQALESAEPLETETPLFEETLEETLPEAQALPDWLMEAQEMPVAGEAETLAEPLGEAAPDWLAEISPAEEPAEAESAEELPDWLRESLAPAAGIAAEMAQAEQAPSGESLDQAVTEEIAGVAEPTPATIEAEEELPGWLFEGEAEAVEAATPAEAEAEEELPGWLFEGEAEAVEAAALAEAEAEEELPGWLFEGEAEAVEAAAPAEAKAEEELPSWLFEGEAEAVEAAAPAEAEAEVELPSWLFEAASSEQAETAEESAEMTQEIPDWLKAAGVAGGAAAAFEASEWLSEEEEQEAAQPVAAETELEAIEPLTEEELPDWLRQTGEPGLTGVPQAEMELQAPETADLFAGEAVAPTELEPGLAAPPVLEAAEGEIQPSAAEVAAPALEENPELAEALAWLDSLLTPVEAVVEEAAAPPEAPPSEPSAEAPMDDEAAFAWLEALAARQGAQEALLLKPEERLETPPEWVLQAAQEPGEPVPTEAISEEPLVAEAEAAAGPETPPLEAQESAPAPMDEEAAFAWLEALAVRQGAQEALLLKPEERLETPPDWVTEAEAAEEVEAPVETAPEEGASAPETVAPAEEAAEEAGPPVVAAAETTAPAPPAAEEVPELPDWLAAPSGEAREETLEWTPPPLSRRKYDLNKITLVELERLPGIGFIMAQRVIDYRNTHGPFKQIDDLLNVPEFSLAALEGVRENLYLEARPEPPPAAARIPTQPRPGTGPLVLATGAGLPKEVVQAREHLSQGYVEQSLAIYDALIRSRKHLTWVIEDLKEASNQYPTELYIWQSLGDAYLRTDQASQALQAYIRAEKLLLQ